MFSDQASSQRTLSTIARNAVTCNAAFCLLLGYCCAAGVNIPG